MYSDSLFQSRNLQPKCIVNSIKGSHYYLQSRKNPGRDRGGVGGGELPYNKAEDAHYLAFTENLPPKYLNANQHHEFQGRIAK